MTTALEGGEWSASRPGRSLPLGKDPVSIVQEAGWAPGPVWTGVENPAPTGIRSPDRPARSQTLPGPHLLAVQSILLQFSERALQPTVQAVKAVRSKAVTLFTNTRVIAVKLFISFPVTY